MEVLFVVLVSLYWVWGEGRCVNHLPFEYIDFWSKRRHTEIWCTHYHRIFDFEEGCLSNFPWGESKKFSMKGGKQILCDQEDGLCYIVWEWVWSYFNPCCPFLWEEYNLKQKWWTWSCDLFGKGNLCCFPTETLGSIVPYGKLFGNISYLKPRNRCIEICIQHTKYFNVLHLYIQAVEHQRGLTQSTINSYEYCNLDYLIAVVESSVFLWWKVITVSSGWEWKYSSWK